MTTTMNKLRLILFSCLLLAAPSWLPAAFGQSMPMPTLSPEARVSLITYGPGNDDISSSFGHTEIRIYDPSLGIDRNYSYGGFNYNTDYFILKFLRGTLPYWLSVHSLYQAVYYYQQNNRSIREQLLNLSLAQRQRLFNNLETNYLPENREYRYKFYYDNCATRPRDMIKEACGDSLQFPAPEQLTKSYRDWMNDYLGEKPWAQLGMNIAIGRPSDQVTTNWESMYLPDNVFNQLAQSTIKQANGQQVPVVSSTQTLFQPQNLPKQNLPLPLYPAFVFAVLGAVLGFITYRQYVQGRVSRWIDRVLFGFAGLCGWLLFLLWVATDHGVTAWNPSLFWLMPLHMPLIFWVTRQRNQRYINRYFGVTAALIVIGLFTSDVPGGAHILFMLTLLIRCVANIQQVRRANRELALVR
ncbi:DUF4105 domain-containing protein [Rudanella paleaurantiibacter]|uniref:DUF4105 domain-containing protein n=2 Tax=Rudanella paleaurantiibacter TaxID=2614655 RepID=A0A7J5TVU1_9BACT|nr:DUF4105 domain-containing protein [Rudanella paleaurantiibacter]